MVHLLIIVKIFEPDSCLRPFIKSFVFVESNTRMSSRLLPGTSLVAAIRLRGNVRFKTQDDSYTSIPMFSISGLRSSYRMAEYASDSSNILVEFWEGGAAAFLDLPLHELFESNIPLDGFFRPSGLTRLQDQLEAHETVAMKVWLVQEFLISKLHAPKTDILITNAVEKIKSSNGLLSVKQLAENLHISLDPFEKRFRKIIGATPKQFSDIIRMKSLIANIKPNHSILDSALDAGFHF
ncbi:MAG: AraC family transcriptional regulator, partial [Chitinophagaceae bacterium]